jgi:hypothetical protein
MSSILTPEIETMLVECRPCFNIDLTKRTFVLKDARLFSQLQKKYPKLRYDRFGVQLHHTDGDCLCGMSYPYCKCFRIVYYLSDQRHEGEYIITPWVKRLKPPYDRTIK